MNFIQAIAIIVGVVSGVSGLVLGILNYLHQRDTSRPRIVVRPRMWNLYDSNTGRTIAQNAGVMEVCNVGQIPVAGSVIGFTLRRRKGVIFIPKPESLGGVEWRQELKPQHIAMLRFNADELPDARELGRAFFTTSVGDRFKASRRDMRRFTKKLKEARLKAAPREAPRTSSQGFRTPPEAPGPAANTASNP